MKSSPLDSSVRGISKALILERVAICFSRDVLTRGLNYVSYLGRQVLYQWATWTAPCTRTHHLKIDWRMYFSISKKKEWEFCWTCIKFVGSFGLSVVISLHLYYLESFSLYTLSHHSGVFLCFQGSERVGSNHRFHCGWNRSLIHQGFRLKETFLQRRHTNVQ